MSDYEPLYLDPTSGAHAHMTEAGEKMCRDTTQCPVWMEFEELEQENAYLIRSEEQHERYLDSMYAD